MHEDFSFFIGIYFLCTSLLKEKEMEIWVRDRAQVSDFKVKFPYNKLEIFCDFRFTRHIVYLMITERSIKLLK